MNQNRVKTTYKLQAMKLLHIAVSVVVFFVFWLLFRYGSFHKLHSYGFRYNIFVTVGYGLMLYWFHRTYNSYLLGYSKIRTLVFGQLSAQIFSLVILYLAVSIGWMSFRAPWIFLPMLAVQAIVDVIWSWLATKLFFRITPVKKTILIYRSEIDLRRFGDISGKPIAKLFRIVRKLRFDGSFAEIQDQLEPYDAIFITGVNSRCRNGILKYCKERDITAFVLPHIGDMLMREGVHIKAFDTPVLNISRKSLYPGYAFLKRSFDIAFSGLSLLLAGPLMLVTALAIRLYDHGPAIYKQTRLTKDGKQFKILKFRSMRVDAEKDGIARLSTGDRDDRITPVGRILRKYRLDELPQLINILKGDMSVVGPRPERPEIAEAYCRIMPDFRLRLQVKAGLTGYAQVYGRYNTEPHEKLEFDLLYIEQMNIWNDLMLCFATFSTFFTAESTQGVEEGRVTALNVGGEAESEQTEGKTETVNAG